MIERMKKLTLLVSEKERDNFVSKLREAGVLHVKHVRFCDSHEVSFIEERTEKIEKMIEILSSYNPSGMGNQAFCPEEERQLFRVADEVESLIEEKKESARILTKMNEKREWFNVWGKINPKDIAILKENGINLRLYKIPKREFHVPSRASSVIPAKLVPACFKRREGSYIHTIKRDKYYIYAALITFNDKDETPFTKYEIREMPDESCDDLEKKIREINEREEKIDVFLRETAIKILKTACVEKDKLKKKHEFLKVKCGMAEEDKFAYLQGFCPKKEIKKIISMARLYGVGYVIEEPDNPDETPTLITNPKWLGIIDPVFKFMNTLPGYNEFDISFYFLLFFSLFFAMLIGDAGYGLLFLIITFFARRKFKNLPREPFVLMYVLSGATVLWGALTGTWFGLLSAKGGNQDFLIYICFMIGAVHLTIAHFLKAARITNSVKVFAEVGWVMILWTMFFAARKFVLGNSFPNIGGWLLVFGITLVLLFTKPEKGILKGALVTLAELPLSVVSSFSDIVSYLRLFAVGYATVIVAKSFNDMAFANGVQNAFSAFGAAIILFLGHTLNILLGFMAVIVHGVRLNMLEFSSHLGMQWSGKKYEPFCK